MVRRCVYFTSTGRPTDIGLQLGPRGGGGGGGGGEGGGNLGVILVRVCEPVFQKLPHSYTWPSKKRTHSYT